VTWVWTVSSPICGQGTTAVIFPHMSDGSRAEWRDLPETLAARGYRTLVSAPSGIVLKTPTSQGFFRHFGDPGVGCSRRQ
jgi:hypothetical protein